MEGACSLPETRLRGHASSPAYLAAQQSVRHHLSLNRLFERQQRPATDPGFGSYWTVNLEAPPGTKRPRKRGRTQKDLQPIPSHMLEKPAYIPVMPIRMEHSMPPSVPSPQHVIPPPLPPPPPAHREDGGHPPLQSTRLRPVDAHSFMTSAVRHSPYDDEDDDEMDWGPGGPQMISDEDFSDEDPAAHPPPTSFHHYSAPLSAASSSSTSTSYHRAANHSHSHSPVNHTPMVHVLAQHHSPPNRAGLHGVFSSSYQPPPPPPPPPEDPVIQKLKDEVEALKRHRSDQEALTIRLSNSLTRAETDAARAKQALKMAESRLEDETRRRIEAERAADEEARLRRHVEEQLRGYQLQRAGLSSPR